MAERRSRLLVAARDCFAANGWSGTTYEQIIVAAQMTPLAAQKVYNNSAACLIALGESFHYSAFVEPLQVAVRAGADAQTQLQAILNGFFNRMDDDPTTLRVLLRTLAGFDGTDAVMHSQHFRTIQRDTLADVIVLGQHAGVLRRSPAAERIAEEWLAALYGHALMGISSLAMIDCLLHGLLKSDV